MQNQHRFNQDGLVRVWPNACGLEASQCAGIIGPGLWQDATGLLPVFHSQTQLHSSTDVPDHIMQNQPGSDLILAGRIKFWPKRVWSGSKPVCKKRLANASKPIWIGNANWIRHVCWVTCMCYSLCHQQCPFGLVSDLCAEAQPVGL